MQMLSSAHHVDFYERARASFGEDGARGGSEGGDGAIVRNQTGKK